MLSQGTDRQIGRQTGKERVFQAAIVCRKHQSEVQTQVDERRNIHTHSAKKIKKNAQETDGDPFPFRSDGIFPAGGKTVALAFKAFKLFARCCAAELIELCSTELIELLLT